LVLLIAFFSGCVFSTKLGPPLALPSGEPTNECEARDWLEVTPVQVNLPTVPRSRYSGTGIFRPQQKNPEDLAPLLQRMQEADLQSRHASRLEPIETRERHALIWVLGGGVGMFAGLGLGAAIQHEHHHTAGTVVGLSSLALGLVGVIAGIVVMPPSQSQDDVEAQHKLLFEGLDDLGAAARGVDRLNQGTRRACAGN
jgi:hypothetical protein